MQCDMCVWSNRPAATSCSQPSVHQEHQFDFEADSVSAVRNRSSAEQQERSVLVGRSLSAAINKKLKPGTKHVAEWKAFIGSNKERPNSFSYRLLAAGTNADWLSMGKCLRGLRCCVQIYTRCSLRLQVM